MKSPTIAADLRDLVLRNILGDRIDELDADRLDDLSRVFLDGGVSAVLAQVGTASETAGALVNARKLCETAHYRLASQDTEESGSWTGEREWNSTLRVLEAHRADLARTGGVVGIGPGFRRRSNEQENEICVVVYVDRKRSPAALRRARRELIPPQLTVSETTVGTDVVELGRLRRQTVIGESLSVGGRRRRGTIGLFVEDLVRSGPAAITAMHVFGMNGSGPNTACVSPAYGLGGSAALGWYRRGTMAGTDAAVIGLGDGIIADNTLPEIGPIRGVRKVVIPDDYNQTVRMWGAETRRVVSGAIIEPLVHLPTEQIQAAILADIPSVAGDSGAALVDKDGFVMGFLVGEIGPRAAPLRVFAPAVLTLQLISCDFPPTAP